MNQHGLVIGKFYPPHAGHHHVIDTAAAACARVSVVVMAASAESIPLAERVAWLRETHATAPGVRILGVSDDHPVDYESAAAWDAHVALMDAALAADTISERGAPQDAVIDTVFSSEHYGAELARRFGARHVSVDVGRITEPVSGRAVRADVPAHWGRLAPATRAGLVQRVVVLGAESTGTTTVARALAEALRRRGEPWAQTQWVPEYGREFTERKIAIANVLADHAGRPAPSMHDLVWTPEDFAAIAARQVSMEDHAAALGSPVLVCDTDAFATGVWFTRYMGGRSPQVEAIGDTRRHPLYLLTDHQGVPFEQDGLRDGEHVRPWMTKEFMARLDDTGRARVMLSGDLTTRVAAALEACDALLASAWRFAEPLS